MSFSIETKRLILKPIALSELDELYALRSDPDVMRYIGKLQTREEVRDFIKLGQDYFDKYRLDFFSVFEKQTGEFVGQAGLFHLAFDMKQPDIELAYRIHKKFWGQGYTTEAAKALIKYGFEQLSLPKIIAIHHPDNLASKRVIEKAGLQYTKMIDYRGIELPCYEIYNDKIKLGLLKDHQNLIPEIAKWSIKEFGYLNPGETVDDAINKLNMHLNTDTLPICFVLLNDKKLIATAALRKISVDTYQSVSPWLGGVMVDEQCRGKGIGSLLMGLVMTEAKKIHKGPWYLITSVRVNFYTNLGWEKIDETVYNDVPGVIMQLAPCSCYELIRGESA